MIMARIAALLVIASQALLVWVCLEPTGRTAILFSFVGHPLVVLGVGLGIWALARRKARERAAARALSPEAR